MVSKINNNKRDGIASYVIVSSEGNVYTVYIQNKQFE